MALKIVTLSLNGLLAAVYGTIAAILFFGLWRHRGRAFNLLGLMLALVSLTAGLSYLAHALIIGLSPWRPEKVTYTVLTAVSLVPTAFLLALYRRFEAFLGGARLLDETRLQLRERNEQLDSLVELSAQLSRFRQVPAVMQSALSQCVAHSRAQAGLYFLRESEAGQLTLAAQERLGASAAAQLAASPAVAGLVQRVLDEGRLLRSDGEEDSSGTVSREAVGFRSLVALPVRSPQGIIGVICLLGRRALAPAEQQLGLLEAVGQQIGVAVESARWFESQDRLGQELQRRVEQATEELRSSYRTLEASERRLQTVVDRMPSGLLMLDADNVIGMVNRQAEGLLGVPREGLLEKPVVACGLSSELVSAVTGGTTAEAGRRDVVLETATPRSVRVDTALVTDHEGQPLGRVCVLTDVTRERETDQMQTDFVSLVSHELRTPLTSILGFVSLLLEGEVGALNATQRRSLESIHRQARRLTGLISDLLDVSRMESRQVAMRQEQVDLGAIARAAVHELAQQAQEKRVRLEFQGATHGATLRGDPERLAQVFTNLLGNAIKFTPRGGRVTVEVKRAGGEVVAVVSDTGPGVAPEELPRVFDKFYQAEMVASRKAGGSGLGLSIVKGIVDAHEGRVEASNRPGGGACFSVHLPARRRPTAAVHPTAPAPLILVVDEDAAATGRLTAGLQHAGYRALAVNDLAEVALQANAVRPALIAFSLRPPNEQTAAMLDALQQDVATRDIPILALGSTADPQALLRGAAGTLAPGDGVLLEDDGADWRHRLGELLSNAGYPVRGVAAGAASLTAQLAARWPGRRPAVDEPASGDEHGE